MEAQASRTGGEIIWIMAHMQSCGIDYPRKPAA